MFRRILACNVRLHICMCIHITYSYTCTLVSLAQMHNFHLAGYALGFMLYVLSPFTFVYRTIQPGPVIFANVRSIVDLFPRDFIFVLSTRPRTKVGQWRNGETPWNKRGGTINDQSRILNDSNETLYFSSFFFFQDSTSGYRTCKTFVEWRRMKNCVSSNMVTRLPYFCSSKIITSLIKPCAHLTLQILWTRAYL